MVGWEKELRIRTGGISQRERRQKSVCHVSRLFSIFFGKTRVDARGCRLNFVRDAQRGDDDDLRVHRYKRVGIQKASAL